jgi:hypothetical protein
LDKHSCLRPAAQIQEVEMHKVIRGVAAVGGFALVFAGSTTWAQDGVRVRGTIERVEGQTLVVQSREGAELKVVLADNALVVGLVKASLSDIKPGSFVGVTGMPQADGSQKALEVHIFPEAMRGTGEGHRPWDLRPQSTMTNANVEQTVAGIDRQTLTLKYKDGEKKVIVLPETDYRVSSSIGNYCADPAGYYPQVQNCAKGWLKARRLSDASMNASTTRWYCGARRSRWR